MSQLSCPYCGARELSEFEFRKTLPPPAASAFARVYLRIDRPELSVEHWQHVLGCRAWLLVRRNPTTDLVVTVQLLGSENAQR